MTLPQPGQVQKNATGIVLDVSNDVPFLGATTTSGYRFLHNGSQFCLAEYDKSRDRLEMNVWNNDGTRSSNFLFPHPYMLDVAYDNAYGVYYGLRWNYNSENLAAGFQFSSFTEGTAGTSDGLLVDEFDSSGTWRVFSLPRLNYEKEIEFASPRQPSRVRVSTSWSDFSERYYTGYPGVWSSDSWGSSSSAITSTAKNTSSNLLSLNTSSGTLGYYSNIASALLHLDVEFSGSVVALVDIDITSLEDNAVAGIRVLGTNGRVHKSFNQLGAICCRGPDALTGIQTWSLTYNADTTGDYWDFCNLRINEVALDPSVSSTLSIPSGTSKVLSVKCVDYRRGLAGPSGESFSQPSTDEHILALEVTDSEGNSYGYAVLGSTTDLTSVDYSENEYTYGDTHRVFSWNGSSGEVLGVDLAASYEFDAVTATFTDYIDAGVKSSSVDVEVAMYSELSGISNSDLRLAIMRQGTTISFLKRDNTDPSGTYTLVSSFDSDYTGELRFELFADATQSTTQPSLVFTQLVVRDVLTSEKTADYSAPSVVWPHPVLTLEAFDLDGNLSDVSSTTGPGGKVIANFDVINSGRDTTEGKFENFLGRAQITTNHSTGTAGEIFINVDRHMYKYLKSDLPIFAAEDGSLASLSVADSIFGAPFYNTLAWNGYTEGGLVYAAANDADPGSGVYINVIRHTTASGNTPVKFCWAEESDVSYALYSTDVNTPSLLYGLSTTDKVVYVYNLDEDASAFCNVVSIKQIMGATTSETSTVTAQVLNIFGDPLLGKTVNFDVSSGDGSVSPASSITNALGEATTVYTVGATVGVALLRATVVD